MAEVLTRASFEAWLATKEDVETVGYGCDAKDCPVANFLQEHGYPQAVVRDEYYAPDERREFSRGQMDDAQTVALEPWARYVVGRVDGEVYHGAVDVAMLRAILAELDAGPA